ncbi:contactin-associated protein-like 2 [Dendronephthya gigantea]|uniref:contactin-associated protein-like 2 n=1 Tax=Dendronephthya gigantea TaxID=151771 RepID=UPI001069F00C|nr:contactin-associated protein-like 2 [Dendronephthya gigantea]
MTLKGRSGVTVIGHDSESRTRVKGYNPAGSYKRKITYEIPMESIVAIAKQSKRCEQYIKYECHHSVFRFSSKGLYYGWWVSRQGSKMNYRGGAAVDSGKCACGMINSCAGGKKCNCDMNDKTWREDSGYLTDKTALPVIELRFGDTSNGTSEEGYHTLRKLRCWG